MSGGKQAIVILGLGCLALWGCEGHGQGAKTGTSGGTGETKVTRPAPDTGEKPDAIMPDIKVSGVPEEKVSGLADVLCTRLGNSGKIELRCAGDIRAAAEQKALLAGFGQCEEEDCLAKLGEAFNADLILHAKISTVGDVILFGIDLVEGKTGKVKTRVSREIKSGNLNDLLPAAEKLAEELIQAL